MNSEDIEAMTVVSLRKELKARNLPTSGNKGELAQRLIEHLANEEKSILQTSGFSMDEILDVPEEVVLGIATADTKLENKAAKTEAPVPLTMAATIQPAKLIQLETKTTISTPAQTSVTKAITPVSTVASVAPVEAKPNPATESTHDKETSKIIPIKAPMSEAEQKMLRAKKFNVSIAQAKEMRAERFGLTKTKDSSEKTAGAKIQTIDQHAAKNQRAERFGLPSAENKETPVVSEGKREETSKLIERARRFGLDEAETHKKIVFNSSDDGKNLSDALRKRKQRFGTETGKVDTGASAAKKMLRAQRFGLKF